MRHIMPILVLTLSFGGSAVAQDLAKIDVTIKDHRFSPSEIHLPAGKPSMLTLRNEDATAEEFDSTALQIEKVIAGGGTVTVRLRPLAPGRFPFMGEYHPDTAQGAIIAE